MKLRTLAAASWSALAVLLAHFLSYRLAYSDPHARLHALEGSGHSWYALLLPALALFTLSALAGTYVSARRMDRRFSALGLYGLSALGFLAIEFIERFMHLGTLAGVWHNVASPAGVLPLVIALLLLLPIIPLFCIAARALAVLARRTPPRPQVTPARFQLVSTRYVSQVFSALAPPRGPPCSLARVRLAAPSSPRF